MKDKKIIFIKFEKMIKKGLKTLGL